MGPPVQTCEVEGGHKFKAKPFFLFFLFLAPAGLKLISYTPPLPMYVGLLRMLILDGSAARADHCLESYGVESRAVDVALALQGTA